MRPRAHESYNHAASLAYPALIAMPAFPEGLFTTYCTMDASAEALFVRAQKSLLVSARARGHIVRVARTLADLERSERIAERHIAEAVGYRGRDSR